MYTEKLSVLLIVHFLIGIIPNKKKGYPQEAAELYLPESLFFK